MTADPQRHYEMPLGRTPFHPRISALNRLNSWGPWAGFTTALALEDVSMEYTAIRNAATVYDLCPMNKYRVSGPDSLAYLNRLTLRNVSSIAVGSVQYNAWCDDFGKVIDDGTVFRLGADEYRICCQERHLPWLLDSASGFDVAIRDVSADIAALSLQGPCAFTVLRAAGFPGIDSLKPFRMVSVALDDGQLLISRTGFTGDLGYELWTTPERALALWDRLFEAGRPYGLQAIGSEALDLARIEAGFIVPNLDFIPAHQALREDRGRSPFELGLEWMIDWKKGHFTGRRSLLDEKRSGSSCWALVGIDIDSNVPAGHALVYHGKTQEVGHVTSAAWSPAAKRNIALAHLRRPYHAEKSNDLWVEIYAQRELQYVKLMLKATICERPFFAPVRRRTTPPGPY